MTVSSPLLQIIYQIPDHPLGLERLCNDRSGEDDDGKHGKYSPEPAENCLHRLIKVHPGCQSEEERPCKKGEEWRHFQPERKNGNEDKGQEKNTRQDSHGIHTILYFLHVSPYFKSLTMAGCLMPFGMHFSHAYDGITLCPDR